MSGSLRVMSFNLHHGVGADGRLDLERCAALVEACGPDAVALQEVDRHLGARSGFVDQPAWLGERLGMAVAYGPTIDLEPPSAGAPRRQYGTALLTRAPLGRWQHLALPRPAAGEPRGLVQAVIHTDGAGGAAGTAGPGTPVRVLATHLQNDSAAGRAAQAVAVADAVAASAEPVILLGDLNAPPHARELAPLTAHLVDAWVAAGDGPGLTFPSHRPRLRIDYVMATPGVAVLSAAVVPTDASDHLPVVADLLVPSPAP